MKITTNFAKLLEAFFTERLIHQRQASPNTIASYRDTFRLLIKFAQQRLKKQPSILTIEDMDAPFIGAFLNSLEKDRGNSSRSRNVRLAAIHSFFRYAALQEPAQSALIQRVLAMPSKRYDRKPIEFLTQEEIEMLLSTPDQATWIGRRDRALILLMVQTGLRVSETIGLCCNDIILEKGAYVYCRGKGRKDRCTPLRKETVKILRKWLREREAQPCDPLFPNRRDGRLSRDSVEYLLAKYVATAQQQCPSLKRKHVSPHILRHSAAMDLLIHGVDCSVIALWLGHERLETTQMYLHADLTLKEQALAKGSSQNVHATRFKPDDQLLAFLQGL